ncbi:MAG TPA: D-alanine--D-alanine ligase [Actinobacteria bacterium]|nr:D-alanine--D-alanine ligase [Actinomycetota bacterium]
MGGNSVEREVSLITGAEINRALSAKNYQTTKIDLDKDVVSNLQNSQCDLVFIALHGVPGEDGTIQGLLDILGLPYVGSGVLASAVGMDKIRSKMLFSALGIPAPFHITVNEKELNDSSAGQLIQRLVGSLGLPMVIKPTTTGSAIGVEIVEKEAQIEPALKEAMKYGRETMAEEFMVGKEITIGLLGNESPRALPAIEIVTERDFYDYKAKYTSGLSKHIIPPRVPEKTLVDAEKFAKAAHVGLGCRGFSRVDFMVDKEENIPYVLEINTIPGMTPLSLFPDAARSAGIEFEDLIEKLIELALE